jgi:hypothetical protein
MHRVVQSVSHQTRTGSRRSHRLSLAGLLLVMLGGLLLMPGLRPRAADATSILYAENFDSAPVGQLPDGWRNGANIPGTDYAVRGQEYYSSPQALRTNGAPTPGYTSVVSPLIVLPADADGGNLEVSFRHKYNLERSFTGYCNDGASLRVSKYSGQAPFEQVAGANFLSGGYTAKINSGANPRYGQDAWCGDSDGWVTTRVRVTGVTSFLQLSWSATFDGSVSTGPWFIDDVQVTYQKKPLITFTATTSDGQPYEMGTLSKLPVNVSARCAGQGKPVAEFGIQPSNGYPNFKTTGAPIAAPTFTSDGLNQYVTATCSYAGGVGRVTQRFEVRIAQTDLTVTVFGPTTAGIGSVVRLTAAVTNIGTRSAPNSVDLFIKVPLPLSIIAVKEPSEARCTTGAPAAGASTIICSMQSLRPSESMYVPIDVRVMGANGDKVTTEASVSPSFPDRAGNNRGSLQTTITSAQADLTTELNAFAGIQMDVDNEVEVRVSNRGSVAAGGVTARVVLPAGLVYLGTVEPDACTAAGQVLTCTFIPNLQAGASDHIEILVHATRNGALFTIEAQADAANLIAESNETNNGATMTVVVGGGPARS